MSLPDTIFIFVLALIIFGPKKLPEIGRQIGKLVGEFRRASNEFKFQIEEELRQADLMEKPAARPAAASPVAAINALDRPAFSAETRAAAENLPAGQHPNIDTLNPAELNAGGALWATDETAASEPASVAEQPTTPAITAAVGTQVRTAVPFAPPAAAAEPSAAEPVPVQAETAHG